MLVYIQKKIKGSWRTLLTVDWLNSDSVYKHFCTQYSQHEFRISLDKTDDMPFKPRYFPGGETLDVLEGVRLIDSAVE